MSNHSIVWYGEPLVFFVLTTRQPEWAYFFDVLILMVIEITGEYV